MFSLTGRKIKKLIKKIKAMKLNRVHNQPTDSNIKKEVSCYFDLIALYKKLKGHKKYPHSEVMILECYRGAAALEHIQAHYELGLYLLNEAKFRSTLDEEAVFNSQDNIERSEQFYKEAHTHLKAAEKLGHIAAKRLRGLCYINGWGVDIDKETGFELVVASIDDEGSWDKVTQIFAEIGLNKPEFFTALTKHRKNT